MSCIKDVRELQPARPQWIFWPARELQRQVFDFRFVDVRELQQAAPAPFCERPCELHLVKSLTCGRAFVKKFNQVFEFGEVGIFYIFN